jgi:hypothetical protein
MGEPGLRQGSIVKEASDVLFAALTPADEKAREGLAQLTESESAARKVTLASGNAPASAVRVGSVLRPH